MTMTCSDISQSLIDARAVSPPWLPVSQNNLAKLSPEVVKRAA
jgi:hypothetical protein